MERILHLHDSSGLYGAESVILSLGAALRETPFKPVIGCLMKYHGNKPELGRVAEESGLDVLYLPMRGRIDVTIIARLATMLREHDIKLIHAHGYKSNMIGVLVSRRVGIPVITTNHLFPPMPLNDRKLQFYSKLDVIFAMKKLAKIVAVSVEISDKIAAAGISRDKLCVIENGIDIDKYAHSNQEETVQLRQSFGIADDSLVVGTFGRLTQQKGQKYLIEAARIVLADNRSVVFLIAGEGPLRNELEAMASETCPTGSIRFLGFRRDTAALLGLMDVFVMSSVDEGLPMAMIEAMASRTPVVMTAVGDIPKVIKNGTNGLLVQPRDSAGLAASLLRILNDSQLRHELAARAFDDARTGYSKEAMCSKYIEVYKEILEN